MTVTQKQPMSIDTATASVEVMDIAVLAGGQGDEREVSLDSGRAVRDALVRLGHRVAMLDIGPDDLSALDKPVDIVFIALHGEFGEDGQLQAELDRRGLRYCGSGAAASRNAMDKVVAKRLFQQAGIPTPRYELVDRETVEGLSKRFAIPAVVKPVASGSSVDTTIARSAGDLQSMAIALVAKDGDALIEGYIDGPELTVGVLGDLALPVCEIRTDREFYDYHAKYVDDSTQYLFEIDLPDELLLRVQKLSLAAHRCLGCSVFSRVDWMIDAATLRPYVLEINTIPGFTSHSLLPKAAGMIGIAFDELCQRIVELSLVQRRGKQNDKEVEVETG